MKRIVNIELLNGWVDRHGITALSYKSGVSVYTLMRVKNQKNPEVPKKLRSRLSIAEAVGVSEDVLFPVVSGDEEKAS